MRVNQRILLDISTSWLKITFSKGRTGGVDNLVPSILCVGTKKIVCFTLLTFVFMMYAIAVNGNDNETNQWQNE